MDILEEIASAIFQGRHERVKELTIQAINGKVEPADIINGGFIKGMNAVGSRFKNGEMFVPEVLMSARSMHAGMDILKPLLLDGDVPNKGIVVIGTVKGDLHDIGKNLVGMMVESIGYKVIDLGVNVEFQKFLSAVKEHKPQILALSALLTTTMPAMQDTIKFLAKEGVRDKVKIIVGGAPVSQEFADTIGADGYAADAASATELVDRLIG